MDEIMVSIYCLAYNHEPYIRDCLEGFVNQKTNFKFEVLIHDDASTDKTADIIREYEAKYPDIIKPIYQTENQYSQGIKFGKKYIYPKMRGKYVAFCEGDDYWCDNNKLQKQFDFLESHPEYSFCVHNSYKLNCTDGTKTEICKLKEDNDITLEDIVMRMGEFFQTSSHFLRREYLEQPDAFPNYNFGDYQRAIYLALSGKVRYLSDIMSVYRQMSVGSWSSANKKNVQREYDHRLKACELLIKIDEYSEFKHHELFIRRETELLANAFEFRKINSNTEYRQQYFKTAGFKKRVLFCAGLITPKLVKKHFERKYQ